MSEKNKILYIANFRMPTEKAHGVQVAKMCEAFGKKTELTLILPKRKNHIKDDLFSFYQVEKKFKVVYLPTIDLVSKIPKLGFWLQSWTFALSVKKYLYHINYQGIVYSRDQFSLWMLKKIKNLDLVYEIHNYPKKSKKEHRDLFTRIKFVCISQGLKDKLVSDGFSEKNILLAPDGVDIEMFTNIKISKEETRKKLSLPIDKKIVMYTGHLYSWKGADILLEAARKIKADVYFIGGLDKDVEDFRKIANNLALKNVYILGRKPHYEIPYYLKAADVLVLPNSGKSDISKYYTSPLKLFEYMASSIPIVASDLPSIAEILNKKNAILVEPDNNEILAKGINDVLGNDVLSDNLAKQALLDIQEFSWYKRAINILNFYENFNQYGKDN